jgi:hypothetical protein
MPEGIGHFARNYLYEREFRGTGVIPETQILAMTRKNIVTNIVVSPEKFLYM